jgi:DNA replicative helicase MCM subunit Mcm2 (Cdc46/Mcm family)
VSLIQKALEILKDMEEEKGNAPVEIEELQDRLKYEGFAASDIEKSIATLKRENDVIFPKNNLIKSVKAASSF